MPLRLTNIVEIQDIFDEDHSSISNINTNSIHINNIPLVNNDNDNPTNVIQSVNFTIPILNVLKQIQQLTIISNEIFTNIYKDITHIEHKVTKLSNKSLKLSKKFDKLTPSIMNPQFSYEICNRYDIYNSKCHTKSQLLSIKTRNHYILHTYNNIHQKLSFKNIDKCVIYYNTKFYPKYKDNAMNKSNKHTWRVNGCKY